MFGRTIESGRGALRTGIPLSIAVGAMLVSALGGSAFAATTTARLIQPADVVYAGAFRMPTGTLGGSTFSYGGRALSFYKDPSTGKRTLFMQGHGYYPGQVAQVEIPATLGTGSWSGLPTAKVMQNFADVTEGNVNKVDPTNTSNATYVTGLLAYNGRMIVGATNTYSFSQTTSHGVAGSLTVSQSGDWKGWYSFTADAPARAMGWMAPIPSEWQAAFGGPALTGQCCVSVISTTSQGPSATVFNPDDVGKTSPIPGKTVLFYPTAHFLRDGSTQNDVYNLTTRLGGVFFPPNTRSVIFVGGHGTGKYCYGTAQECGNDTAMPDVKGPHAQPYRYQAWAYDANDLAAVKSGSKAEYQPQPYAVFELKGMHNSGNPNISGATFDPETGYLYITQDYGEEPTVEVFKVSSVATPVPAAPTNVTVQ